MNDKQRQVVVNALEAYVRELYRMARHNVPEAAAEYMRVAKEAQAVLHVAKRGEL